MIRKLLILIMILLPILLIATKLNADGTGYISFSDFSANDALTGTAILYYKPADISNQGYYIGYYDGSTRLYFRRETNNMYSVGFGGTYFGSVYYNPNTNIQCMLLIYDNGTCYAINNDSIYYTNSYSDSIILSANSWRIGTGEAHSAYMIGDILEFRYYDNAFDTTYAKYISSQPFPPIEHHEDSLVIYLSADNISTTKDTIYDVSGNNYHGIITNMTEEPGYYIENSNSKSSHGKFTGSEYLNYGTQTSLNLQDSITIQCFVEIDTFLNSWIIAKNNSSSSGFGFFVHDTDTIRTIFGDGTNGTWFGLAMSSVQFGETHNKVLLSAVYDAGSMFVYVDTTIQEIYYDPSPISYVGDASHFAVGARTNLTDIFQGNIYDVKIYNRALTKEDIVFEYKNSIPKDTSNLKYWVNFKNFDNDSVYDEMGNYNTRNTIIIEPGE